MQHLPKEGGSKWHDCVRTHMDHPLPVGWQESNHFLASLPHPNVRTRAFNETLEKEPELIMLLTQYTSAKTSWHQAGTFNPPVDARLPHCPLDPLTIAEHENRTFSQYGADGVLSYVCSVIGCPTKRYVEFGAQDCKVCNSRALRARGWTGLVMDGGFDIPEINLRKEIITVENIVFLLHKYGVKPHELDVLVVDIDGADFYVLRTILCNKFRPRIIVVEYQERIPSIAGARVTPLAEPPSRCIGFCNGMSVGAVRMLGRRFGYELIHTMTQGVDAVLVRSDLLPAHFQPAPLVYFDRPWTQYYKPWPHWVNLKPYQSSVRWLQAQPRWDRLSDEPHASLLKTCDKWPVVNASEVPPTPQAYGDVADPRSYGG